MGWRSLINTTIYTDKVDMNVATPVFIDSIGQDYEEKWARFKRIGK